MAASPFTAGTWPRSKKELITTPVSSDIRQLQIQFNLLLTNLSTLFAKLIDDCVLVQGIPSTGTTNTMATAAQGICINGVPALVAAETAKAFGALGTIPASLWGLIAVERVADATTSFTSAAANYTTGYATEALAIAALPAQSANKVQTGYITILASASTWIAGTDGLALGSGGNVATSTNFYATASVYDTTAWTANQIATLSGTVLTSSHY
jgi:hypothetical protein